MVYIFLEFQGFEYSDLIRVGCLGARIRFSKNGYGRTRMIEFVLAFLWFKFYNDSAMPVETVMKAWMEIR